MAESEKSGKNGLSSHLKKFRETRSAVSSSVSKLPCVNEKDKLDKRISDLLLSCETELKCEADDVWVCANAISLPRQDVQRKSVSYDSSLARQLSQNLRVSSRQHVCYELDKRASIKSSKICSWPICSQSHPCRGSDPLALESKKSDDALQRNTVTRSRSVVKIANRRISDKISSKARKIQKDALNSSKSVERIISLPRKSSSPSCKVDFAHVVPPPPIPIMYTFSHYSDPMMHLYDYRKQHTYKKLLSMQKSAKVRQPMIPMRTFAHETCNVVPKLSEQSFRQESIILKDEDSSATFQDEDASIPSTVVTLVQSDLRQMYPLSKINLEFVEDFPSCFQSLKHSRRKTLPLSTQKMSGRLPKIDKLCDRAMATYMKCDNEGQPIHFERNGMNATEQKSRSKINVNLKTRALSLPSSPKKIVKNKSVR